MDSTRSVVYQIAYLELVELGQLSSYMDACKLLPVMLMVWLVTVLGQKPNQPVHRDSKTKTTIGNHFPIG